MPRRRAVILIAAAMVLALAGLACGFGLSQHEAAPFSPPTAGQYGAVGPGSEPSLPTTPTLAAQLSFLPAPTPTFEAMTVSPLPAPPAAIPEWRRLTLEYPAAIRAGDSDVIRLTLEVDALGGAVPTAEVQGNLVTGGAVQIPNLYQTHNVVAEADLDLAGVDFQPNGPVSEPLLPGESVTFRWSVHPTAPGTYRGTAWLFLVFTDKATGALSRKAISAQPVQIEATTLFGLSGDAGRIAGGLGAVGGGVLGFPFADDVIKWLWTKARRRT